MTQEKCGPWAEAVSLNSILESQNNHIYFQYSFGWILVQQKCSCAIILCFRLSRSPSNPHPPSVCLAHSRDLRHLQKPRYPPIQHPEPRKALLPGWGDAELHLPYRLSAAGGAGSLLCSRTPLTVESPASCLPG